MRSSCNARRRAAARVTDACGNRKGRAENAEGVRKTRDARGKASGDVPPTFVGVRRRPGRLHGGRVELPRAPEARSAAPSGALDAEKGPSRRQARAHAPDLRAGELRRHEVKRPAPSGVPRCNAPPRGWPHARTAQKRSPAESRTPHAPSVSQPGVAPAIVTFTASSISSTSHQRRASGSTET